MIAAIHGSMLHGSMLAVAVADALEETPFLVGERGQAVGLDFLEQLVHAPFLGLALLLLALHTAGRTALLPPLPPALPPPSRRRRLALQAGIALREVVAEHRLPAAGLEQDPLLIAAHVNEH